MNRPRMLIVTRVFPPSLTPEAFCSYKIAVALINAGVDLKILTCIGNELQKNFEYKQITQSNLLIIPPWSGGRIKRYVSYGSYAALYMVPPSTGWFCGKGINIYEKFKKESEWKPDVIYARGLPEHGYYLTWLLSKKYNIPFIMHLSDPWPEKYLPAPYKKGRVLKNLIESVTFRKVIKRAAGITFPSKTLLDYMISVFPELKGKQCEILPHIILNSQNDLMKENNNSPVESIQNNSKMKIVHLGTLDGARSPLSFLKALKRFINENGKNIHVQFVGVSYVNLKEMVEDMKLEDTVSVIEPVSYDESLKIGKSADVLLLIEAPMEKGIFLPSKFVDYCSIGLPILALSPPEGEVASYLKSINLPVVSSNNTDGIYNTLLHYYDLWRQGNIKKYSSAPLRQFFSESSIITRFLNFFSKLDN